MRIRFYWRKKDRMWLTGQPGYRWIIALCLIVPLMFTALGLWTVFAGADLREVNVLTKRGVVQDCWIHWRSKRIELTVDNHTLQLPSYAVADDREDVWARISQCEGRSVSCQYIDPNEDGDGLLLQITVLGIPLLDDDYALQTYTQRNSDSKENAIPLIAASWLAFVLLLPLVNGCVRLEFSRKEKLPHPPLD